MIGRQSRNISLTPEFETFIADRLASGDRANASEFVRAGLCALRNGTLPPSAPAEGWPAGGGGAARRMPDDPRAQARPNRPILMGSL